jgi:uncharacterized membrane protein YcaP (DUF421 family)
MNELPSLFEFSVPPIELIVRGTFVYVGLVLLFRFVLRRDLGQLGVADVLFIVLIADAAQNGMAGEYRTLADAFVLLATLAACNLALDWAVFRFEWMQRVFEPPSVELVRAGRILRRNLKREWMTVDELLGKLRQEGIADVADVKLAILERDGKFSVVKETGRSQPTDPAKSADASGTHIGEKPDRDAK